MPADFHFIRPLWFLAFIPSMLAIIFLLRHKAYSLGWSKFCDKALFEHLSINSGIKQKRYPIFLLALGWIIAIFAMAGPSWQKINTPLFSSKDSLVIILDLSQSMNAQDLSPSRLARARHKLRDLLKQRDEGQTALIVYAGDSHIVSPLTADSKTILSMVPILNSNLMPVPGSYLEQALDTAINLFKNAGEVKGKMLLLSDGIDPQKADSLYKKAEQINQEGYQLSVIGIASLDGAPIPSPNKSGYLKDKQGNIFISRLDPKSLAQLAQKGGGKYQTISVSDNDFNHLFEQTANQQFDSYEQDSKQQFKQDKWQDEGIYLVLMLIPFALLAFRRGWILLVIIIVLPVAEPSYAISWSDLWLRSDQQGQNAFQQGQHEDAAKKFQNLQWQGSAYYRAGKYEQALDAFSQSDDTDSLYNKANTLAKLNRYEEARQAYQEVLKKDPKHQDSIKNKALVEQALKQKKEQEQQQKSDQQQSEQDQSEKNQQQNDSQQQNSQQEQQSNSEKQQQESEQASKNQEKQQAQNNHKQDSEQQQQQDKQTSDAQEDQKSQQNKSSEDTQEEPRENLLATENKPDEPAHDDEKNIPDTQFSKLSEEQQQSMQQYLQQIPDDPSYLLKRKFYLNSRRNPQQQQENTPW